MNGSDWVSKVSVFPNKSSKTKTLAFAGAELALAGGRKIWLNGLTVVNGVNGLFLGLPNQKKGKPAEGKEQKYEDVYFFNKEDRAHLQDLVLAEYDKKIGKH
jgi:DNA-binding cell septation regulator SpoVG